MLKRLGLRLADLAVKQSKDRISRASVLAGQSRELTRLSRGAINLSRELMSLVNIQPSPRIIYEDKFDEARYILANLTDSEMEEFTDELIDTYVIAQERGDAEMEADVEQALLAIGHYLARRMGPKLAGVSIN